MVQAPSRKVEGRYEPHPIHKWKADIVRVAKSVSRGRPPVVVPLALHIVAVFPRPAKLLTKRWAVMALPHAIKPDADNVAKAVQDCLNGVIWRDDCVISELTCRKRYAVIGEESGIHVVVYNISLN